MLPELELGRSVFELNLNEELITVPVTGKLEIIEDNKRKVFYSTKTFEGKRNIDTNRERPYPIDEIRSYILLRQFGRIN